MSLLTFIEVHYSYGGGREGLDSCPVYIPAVGRQCWEECLGDVSAPSTCERRDQKDSALSLPPPSNKHRRQKAFVPGKSATVSSASEPITELGKMAHRLGGRVDYESGYVIGQ